MAGPNDTLAKRLKSVVEKYPQNLAQLSKNESGEFTPTTYQELYDTVKRLSTRLNEMGVERGSHIGIISDNRREWIVADFAVLCLGAVDVPRGSDSTEDEIEYILAHADCKITFAENEKQVNKIISRKKSLPLLKTIISLDTPEKTGKIDGIEVMAFETLVREGEESVKKNPDFFEQEIEKGTPEEVVTLLYTSGTTGEPKGVILTNRNYVFQLERVYEHIEIKAGQIFMSVLPTWHSFERLVEYVVINIGATLAYSKLVGSILMPDMANVRPHWMAAVPRLWEGIRAAVYRNATGEGGIKKALFLFFVSVGELHAKLKTMVRGLIPQFKKRSRILDFLLGIIPLICLTPLKLLGGVLVFGKVKKKLGGRFISAISGGGALPPYVDMFFQAIGITLLEGYGLTESAPVISVRKLRAPVPGTVGPILRDIEARVIGEDMAEVSIGEKGVLHIKSEQIMLGYYKRPEATAEVLKDGWLNTGDIVMMTHNRDLRIIGRAKETIVLMGGENVEPTPIEEKLKQAEGIEQVMIVGQDKKYLAALIVPSQDFLEEFAKEKNLGDIDKQSLLENAEIQDYFRNEIQSLVGAKTGFKAFERISKFKLIADELRAGEEMTHTLKIKRNVVTEKYKREIEAMFA